MSSLCDRATMRTFSGGAIATRRPSVAAKSLEEGEDEGGCWCRGLSSGVQCVGMVQLDKSLCQSHDATQVRKGLSRAESRGGSVSETERYTSLSSTEKHST
jgi:hypothetical protein